MAKPENGFQPEGTPLTFEPRPKEVNKILNSKHVLSDVDTSDPSNARVFVANFLNSKYSEDKRGIYKDYEGKTKAYGLSGDPVADAKSILDGDTKTHESSQTRIAKDRKVIAEGLERLEPEEGQGFIEKQAKVVGSTGSKMGWSIFRSGLLLSGELFNDRLRDELRAEYDRSEGNKVSASNPIVSREELVDFSSKMVASTEKAFDVDPEYANTMEGAILSGLTQITAQIATGGLGLPAQMYDEGIQDAEASMGKLYSEMTMLEQAKARQLAGPYALVATGLEALPLGKMFKNLTGTTKEVVSKMNSKGFLKEFGAGFLGEGITESAQKQLLGELGKRVLEDGRDVWNVESLKDLAKEFLVAGTVGGIARGGPVAASKALNKLMDPVEGMSAVDMALAYNVIPEPEFNLYIEEQFGDQTTEEGVPLQELAKKARQGDRKAAEELVANTTVEASQAAVEAGLTPAEAEARGKEAAEVADPIEPLVETAIDKEISAKKEELAALEEAEDSTPEDMKVGEKLDKEIQALETKRDEKQRPTDVLSAQAREEAAAEEAGLLTRRAEDEIEIDKAEEVADAIDFFEQRSRGGVTKDYKPDTRKGGEALIKQMRRAGMSKKEIAAKSLQIMTEAGRPNDRLSDQVVRGEQTSNSKAGNDFRATVKLYKDADPMDVAEEYIHAETDREINEGTINYEDIAAYREQVESITSGEDTRGNTEGDHKEWIAEQVKARLLGNRHDTRLPESFARFIDRIISRLRNLFTRANELIELEAQGMLPDGFVELLDRLGSMDDDALMQSIQAEQAAETASDPKDELLEVMKRNKLSVPRPDSDPSHRGELETYFESIGKKWKYLKKGGSLDGLKEGLQAAGFNVDTPSDVLDLLDRSARGEAIYANTDSRSAAQQTADETFSLDPEVRLDRGAESSFSLEPEEYRGQHKAPNRTDEISASLDALGDVYPSNIYSSKALQYYRTGDDYMDRQSIDILQGLADDPDAKVTIHRAIPVDANEEINAGDWVTVNYDYAEMHGESALNGDYVIVSEEVPASDVFTNADSIHEQGYDPKAPSFSLAPAPSGVEVSISEESDKITLNKLIVDKDARGSGKGSEYMNTLTEYADATGKRITLTPSKDFGGSSVSRLKAFYKRFGFVENKGKNKDFEEFDSMYREPTEPSYSLEPLSEQDAAYLLEVESDNMEAAQEMVDEQARMRGYNPLMRLFHGTKKRFDKLKSTRDPNGLIYFSTNEEMAQTYPRGSGGHRTPEADVQARIDNARLKSREYTNPAFEKLEAEYGNDIPMDLADEVFAKEKEIQRSLLDGMTVPEADIGMGIRVIGGYIKAKDIFEPSNWREFKDVIMESIGVESEAEILPQMMDAIESGNYIVWEKKAVVDAVLSKYDAMTIQETSGKPAETIAFRDPSQIKSSDPVTYDADGNVIPLSERFDPTRDEVSFSLEPLSEQDADAIVTERTEEIQSRTPERQAFIDYQRELRRTQLDNTEEEKKKLQKLLQLATDADEIAELKQAGDEKIIRVVEQKVKQIRKQAAEREDVTESVKALERLINSPEVPMEVRARMRGFGRLAERKTPQGKARWVEQMSNKLEAEIDRHYRTRNVRTLRSLLRPFATEYAPNRRKLRERVGEEARADLNFAQRLLNNSEATPPEGMTDERRDELIDIFGDVGNRQSNPTRVKAALEIAGSIAKGGRTARDEFKDQRREDNADLANQVTAQVLNTEDAMDASEITANERSKNKFSKFVSNAASVAVRGMEGLQQQLNKLDRVKGGFLETMFLSAAFQAQQTELAMNNEQADQTMKDFETVLGSDSKVAAAWYKGSHKMHQTDIEWINNKKVGMKKRKMSKQQGVSLLMQWLDPSLRPTFTNMGINESTIEQVKEFIGEIGVSEAYYFREKYAEMGIKLNAKHMEVEGIPLDMIDGYGGRARRQRGATKEEDMQMFAKNSAGRPTVKSGSMKERTNSVDYLMFMDADTDFTAHSREVNHYISHAELAHNMSAAFLNNEDARNAIKQKHGSKFYSSLAAQIEAIIGGDPQTTDLERILTEVRSNLTKASLMVKPAIMIKQLTSAPAFAEEIGPVAFAKASAAMLKPANLKKFMPMIWKSQYVKNRMSSSQFTDVQNSLDARSNVMRSLRWHDWAMINIKIGDIGAVVMGGTPVYYHAYTEAKASGMTDDQAQFKAEEVFGIASERAQQSSATHAQGSFLRDKTWMRSWFMYLTSPLQYQRNVNTAIGNFVAQSIEWKNDRPSDAKKAAKQAANAFLIYHVLLPQIFQAVASGLVGFTDDEDYIKEKFAKRQLRALMLGNLNTFPLLGSFLSGLANSISGADETFNSSGSPVLDLVMKTNAKWNKALKDGEDMSKFTDVLIEASQLGGIPAKTAISYYEAITDVSEGNTEHPLLRLGGWSKYATMED